MSMTALVVAVPPAQLDSFIAAPDTIEAFLDADDDDIEGPEDERRLDLDKAWHGIHFVLNGVAWGGEWPLVAAVHGGTEIGEDMGYGPARLPGPDDVREVAASLPAPDEFDARIDLDALSSADIYPDVWDRKDEGNDEWLVGEYRNLVKFFRSAASRGDGLLSCIW